MVTPAAESALRYPSTVAGYSTPWIATDLEDPMAASRARKKGGPTRAPTLPGSQVPRAKTTVTSAHPLRLAFILRPNAAAKAVSPMPKAVQMPSTGTLTGNISTMAARNAFRFKSRFSMAVYSTSDTGAPAAKLQARPARTAFEKCMVSISIKYAGTRGAKRELENAAESKL